MKISAIIPAAGSGSRYSKTKNKLLEELNGVPVIVRTLKTIASVDEISEIVVCTSINLIQEINQVVQKYNIFKIKKIVLGGQTRQESVFNGLNELKNETAPDLVVIHDGARPLITTEIIKKSISIAINKGASIVAVPSKDTIKRINPETGEVVETPDRIELWNVQTPQVFRFNEILQAHENFFGQNMTDDSVLMEKAGYKVFVTRGNYKNIKITTEEDLKTAEIFIS